MQIEKENDTIFYKYDNQGNTLEEHSSKGTTTYTYDIYNRTKEVITETGDHIKNSYTPLGLRYKKEVNGVVSRYIVDDWNIIAEVDKENNVKSREIRGYKLLKKESGNKDYFYHTNEHGDIVYLTNEKEEIENSYSYDVFGNIKEQKEAISNQFKYTGEQYDSEVQQYYLRARFYNPTIGRFTQEDVYRGDGLNLYTYVVNNPLLWIDPSGYAKCSQNNEKSETGEYKDVGGHHIHAKAAFRDDPNYDLRKAFSISQKFMKDNNLSHSDITSTQRRLFKELHESKKENTLEEHTTIAREALKAGGASDKMIDYLISKSLENLSNQGVTKPTRIPWYT